ncbi:MAG: hypothetical protein Q8R07_03175, partial [Candidatus Uhrbacteria bacterium]|nr:hypothetical protein [Candidatus Uhrbacteria bacterium]
MRLLVTMARFFGTVLSLEDDGYYLSFFCRFRQPSCAFLSFCVVMWSLMSWQRILELARQRGLPVIVTDIGGREPMAILPLE